MLASWAWCRVHSFLSRIAETLVSFLVWYALWHVADLLLFNGH